MQHYVATTEILNIINTPAINFHVNAHKQKSLE